MTTTDKIPCPLCKQQATGENYTDDSHRFHCNRCGDFVITGTAKSMLDNLEVNPFLCAWTRNSAMLPTLDSHNIKSISESLESMSVGRKQLKLLHWIAKQSTYPGAAVVVYPHKDWPVAYCLNDTNSGITSKS